MARFTPIRDIGLWREIAAAAWRAPNDPSVYGRIAVDFTNGLAFLEGVNRGSGGRVTVTHLVAKAAALVIRRFPEVNAILRRRRFHRRETVDLFVQVAIDESAAGGMPDLSGAKIASCDEKSLAEIAGALKARSGEIRSRKDPQFRAALALLKWVPRIFLPAVVRFMSFLVYDLGLSSRRLGLPDDPFGSAMITNMGSLGAPAGFAPFFPPARVPLIVCVGEVRKRPWVVDDRVAVRPVLDLAVTFDHRFLDGLTAARMNRDFVEILSDPGRFLTSEQSHPGK